MATRALLRKYFTGSAGDDLKRAVLVHTLVAVQNPNGLAEFSLRRLQAELKREVYRQTDWKRNASSGGLVLAAAVFDLYSVNMIQTIRLREAVRWGLAIEAESGAPPEEILDYTF